MLLLLSTAEDAAVLTVLLLSAAEDAAVNATTAEEPAKAAEEAVAAGMSCLFSNLQQHKTIALQRKSHLCISRKEIAPPQSQFPYTCVCKQFIYSLDRSKYEADRLWEYINRAETHE